MRLSCTEIEPKNVGVCGDGKFCVCSCLCVCVHCALCNGTIFAEHWLIDRWIKQHEHSSFIGFRLTKLHSWFRLECARSLFFSLAFAWLNMCCMGAPHQTAQTQRDREKKHTRPANTRADPDCNGFYSMHNSIHSLPNINKINDY